MKRWLIFTMLGLMLFILFLSDSVRQSVAQSFPPPRNVRIVREGPGGPDDELVARWDAPSSGNVQVYYLDWRRKFSDVATWEDWNYLTLSSSNTSREIASVSNIPENQEMDFQVSISAIHSGGQSDEVTASLRGVGRIPRRSSGGGGSKSRSSKSSYVPKPTPLPPQTCELLSNANSGIFVSSLHGLGVGIQCQQLDGSGIGIPSVIEAGFIVAVDVWGIVRQARVCFSHDSGSLVFLDAATAPRSIMSLETESDHGMICASIDRPGSVVLLPEPGIQATGATESVAVTDVSVDSSKIEITMLQNCRITTNYILNLRDAPAGSMVLAWVPYLETMAATARTSDWFRVVWRGFDGWLYARMVSASGVCS